MEKSIFFEITDICNHKCIHCCKSWRTDCNHTMNKEMLDKIISFPKKSLTISGGEPSLVKDRVYYVIDRVKCPVTINTNLTNWNKVDLDYFRNKNIRLSVSVVSMVLKEYEAITGAKTYWKFIENLSFINRDSKIVIIVNEHNKDNLKQTVDRLAVLGFNNFIISPRIPNGISKVNTDDCLEKIIGVYKCHRNLKIETMNQTNSVVPYNHDCDAGVGRLVILSNGDIVPCACFTGHILGNIMESTFSEVSTKGNEFYNSFPFYQQKKCKGIITNIDVFKETMYNPEDFASMCKNLGYALSHVGYHKNKKYLDLCCGFGFLYYMLPSDVQYTGVDIKPQFDKAIKADVRDFINSVKIGEYDYIIFTGGAMFFNTNELIAFCEKVLSVKPEKFFILTNTLKDNNLLDGKLFPDSKFYKKTVIFDKKKNDYNGNDIIANGVLYERV